MRQPVQTRTESASQMESAYSVWVGQPVVLCVAVGELQVPLHGKLVGVTAQVLQLRIAGSLDLHIMKSAVLAIEEDAPASAPGSQASVGAALAPPV